MADLTWDHYVSRSYLAGFTVDGRRRGRLFETNVIERVVNPTKPRYVAARPGFDRIDVPGLASDAFEKALSSFESHAIAAIRSICQSDTMGDESLSRALGYAALLLVRNPRMRDGMTRAMELEARIVLDAISSNKRRFEHEVARAKAEGYIRAELPPSLDEIWTTVRQERYRVEVPVALSLQLEMDCFDDAALSLVSRSWTLVTARDDAPDFVTCDHPVSLVWRDPEGGGHAPIGYETPGSELSFPLDARHALVGVFEDPRPPYVLGRPQLIGAINSRTVHQAYRSVYSRTPVVTVLRNRAGLTPLLDHQGSRQ